jgi:predicted nucleotidyltransferase
MITEADRNLVEEFKRRMGDRGVSFLETIVFGSRARGDADAESDLDILIIVEQQDRQTREQIRRCAWEVGFENGLFIQTIVITRDEMENTPLRSSLLVLAVREEGVRV